MKRINVGCGNTPTAGWINFDNSPSVRLASLPRLANWLYTINLVTESQKNFIDFAQRSDIRWADATKHIPLPDNSVDVVYSSHMVEHLSKAQALSFFKEAKRVLVSGGVLRIVVPDISKHVQQYCNTKDADVFIQKLLFVDEQEPTFADRVRFVFLGNRLHRWMYDGFSLKKLILSADFQEVMILDAGKTLVDEVGALNLYERFEESVYVEAINSLSI